MYKNILNRRRPSTKTEKNASEEQPKQKESLTQDAEGLMPMMLDLPAMRLVALYGDLDEKKASEIVLDLMSFRDLRDAVEHQIKNCKDKTKKQLYASLAHKDPVKFLISTFGGNAVDMFGIYDLMVSLKDSGIEMHTVGSGKVMSAGVLLLAAGTKGHRTIGRNCRVMVHPVVGGAHGPSHDIQNEVEEILQTQQQYVECLAKETKLSISRLNKLISEKRNIYLSAEEAVKFGIADKIE
jgi:ATP-dependent Clp protease protease subunit